MRPVVSLIVSSYNQPNALALVLEGVLTQTRPVDELVVADDGSEPDTAALVDEFAAGPAFATAGYVLMSLARTEALSIEHVATGRTDELCTPDERRQFHRIHRREQLYRLLRKAKKPKILGGNWAVTRAGLVAVNGFDEKFDGFGKEDSDIRNRLANPGFRGRSVWRHNWVCHCSHDLDPRRNLAGVFRGAPDYEYYESRRHATSCEFGLEQQDAAAG